MLLKVELGAIPICRVAVIVIIFVGVVIKPAIIFKSWIFPL